MNFITQLKQVFNLLRNLLKIGMRFALVEMKILLAKILSKYKFNKCEQTPVILRNYLFKLLVIL